MTPIAPSPVSDLALRPMSLHSLSLGLIVPLVRTRCGRCHVLGVEADQVDAQVHVRLQLGVILGEGNDGQDLFACRSLAPVQTESMLMQMLGAFGTSARRPTLSASTKGRDGVLLFTAEDVMMMLLRVPMPWLKRSDPAASGTRT